jgi:deoxyadenosine/deoxycytidine kinase
MTKVIVIDGLIGAGKTTLINVLCDGLSKLGLKVKCIMEPVDIWKNTGNLQAFYNDIERNAYEFQTYTYITRIKKYLEEYDNTYDIIFMERCIFTDKYVFVEMLYDEKFIDARRYAMYNEWWALWKQLITFDFSGFIYLNPDINACMDRIKSRNRDGESNITLEYQADLLDKYEKYFYLISDKYKVLNIISNENFKNDEDVQQRIITLVLDFIKSL